MNHSDIEKTVNVSKLGRTLFRDSVRPLFKAIIDATHFIYPLAYFDVCETSASEVMYLKCRMWPDNSRNTLHRKTDVVYRIEIS